MNTEQPLLSGTWNHGIRWEIFAGSCIPTNGPIVAVSVIPFFENKIVLTKNHRGWDLIGGHCEVGETPEETLARETFEEAGAKLDSYHIVAYTRITNEVERVNKTTNLPYPLVSYSPFYSATCNEKPIGPSVDSECSEVGFFTLDDVEVQTAACFKTLQIVVDLNKKI